jgi:hypothetical protein
MIWKKVTPELLETLHHKKSYLCAWKAYVGYHYDIATWYCNTFLQVRTMPDFICEISVPESE